MTVAIYDSCDVSMPSQLLTVLLGKRFNMGELVFIETLLTTIKHANIKN